MFVAMAATFHAFSARMFVQDALRISGAAAMIVGAGAIAGMVPIPWSMAERLAATIKLGEIALGGLIVAWPALILTRSLSNTEKRIFLDALSRRRRSALAVSDETTV